MVAMRPREPARAEAGYRGDCQLPLLWAEGERVMHRRKIMFPGRWACVVPASLMILAAGAGAAQAAAAGCVCYNGSEGV